MSKEWEKGSACELCNGRLVKKAVRTIGNARYNILECEKCKHTIAKRIEEIIKV